MVLPHGVDLTGDGHDGDKIDDDDNGDHNHGDDDQFNFKYSSKKYRCNPRHNKHNGIL